MNNITIFASRDIHLNNRLLKIISSLRKLNYSIEVISFNRDKDIKEEQFIENKIKLRYVKLKFPPPSLTSSVISKILAYVEFLIKYILICFSVKGEIIWCEGIEFTLFGLLSSKILFRKKVLIYDARELYLYNNVFTHKPLYLRIILWLWEFIVIRFSDVVIATNIYRLNFMKRVFYINNKKSFILENLPSDKIFNTSEEVDDSYLEFIKDKKVIGYIGEIREGRGVDMIVDVLKFIPDNVVFVCFGNIDSNFKNLIEEKIKELNLERRIKIFRPFPYKKLLSIIKYFDVGISIIENLSLNNYYCSPSKFYDYIFAQVPVIVSNNPPLVNVIETFKCGEIIYDLENKNEFIEKICKILENKGIYKVGLSKASKLLTWEFQEKLLLDVIGDL